MATVILIIIYIAFISLGLPDSLLGAGWPLMRLEFNQPLEAAGPLVIVLSGGTIISSFASGYIIRKLGAGKVTAISTFMTAAALLGMAYAPAFWQFFALAIPLGFGAGSIDAALNQYVAVHYKARHMSWLHSFWGVGATLSPILLSLFIAAKGSWRGGYLAVGLIQLGLTALLFLTLPLWKKAEKQRADNAAVSDGEAEVKNDKPAEKINPLRIKGVKTALIAFLFYCGAEATVGLWGASYLVAVKGLTAAAAAGWISSYYMGITAGRFISGFVTFKVSSPAMIRAGQAVSFIGMVLILAPLPDSFMLAGFILTGLGYAPIYPSMLHETPARFGKENSLLIMGYQMGFAYVGTTFLPPLLGWIASFASIKIFPFFILSYIIFMLIGSEVINGMMKGKKLQAVTLTK